MLSEKHTPPPQYEHEMCRQRRPLTSKPSREAQKYCILSIYEKIFICTLFNLKHSLVEEISQPFTGQDKGWNTSEAQAGGNPQSRSAPPAAVSLVPVQLLALLLLLLGLEAASPTWLFSVAACFASFVFLDLR